VALALALGMTPACRPNGSPPEAEARTQQAIDASPEVVVSQVYGGGSNVGAPLQNDFVELFNRSGGPVALDGWSIQYTSATGTGPFSGAVTLLAGTVAPGQRYLVRMAGGANGAPLPAPDATGTTAMSSSAGKVALVNTTVGLACNGGSITCSPADIAHIIDLVGYGNANFFEGAGPAGTLSNTTAAPAAHPRRPTRWTPPRPG
jgi:hypothetical protein